MNGTGSGVEREVVLTYLERVLASTPFRQADRSAGLLRYLVERSVNGTGDRVKEYTVGVEALGRKTDFDPRTDPIVRAEASRLRGRLERYYADEGRADAIVIELPKGSYAPRVHAKTAASLPPIDDERPTPAPRSRGRLVFWAILGVAAVGGAFGMGLWRARVSSPVAEAPMRLEVMLQSDERLASDVGTDVVISPDGKRVVFVSIDSVGTTHLRVRTFDGSGPVDLPGTVGGRGPFWSPDSRWIGFWAAGQLRKVAVNGGPPVVLCSASDLLGASWSEDGSIIAALDATPRLFRVDGASGGTAVILDLAAEKAAPRWPQVLPGGRHVLYTVLHSIGVDRARIEVVSIDGKNRRVLVEGGTFGRYVAPGHLTYVNQGALYAIRFDRSRLETSGASVPILDDLAYSTTWGHAQYSVSETGTVLYRRASLSGPLVVSLVDSMGHTTPLVTTSGAYGWPSLSPDKERLALVAIESGVPTLSVLTNLRGRARVERRIPGYSGAIWTQDGRHLIARSDSGIAAISALGGMPRKLIESSTVLVPWSFAPGDRHLFYAAMGAVTALDLWMAPVEKGGDTLRAGVPVPIVQSADFEAYPAVSPDGRWLAYSTNRLGSGGLFIRSLTDSAIVGPLVPFGRVPRWSQDGRQLFYATPHRRVMAVDIDVTNGRLVAGTPRQWAPIGLADTGVLPNYDLYDDRHIVALLPEQTDGTDATHVVMISRFPDELRRKAP